MQGIRQDVVGHRQVVGRGLHHFAVDYVFIGLICHVPSHLALHYEIYGYKCGIFQ